MNLKCFPCMPWKETSTHESRECWWDKKQTSTEGVDGKELHDVGLEYPFQYSVLIFSKGYNIWWWEQNLFSWWTVLHRKHLRSSLVFLVPCACTGVCKELQHHSSELPLLWVYLEKGKSLHWDWAVGSYGDQLWRNGELLWRAEPWAGHLQQFVGCVSH